MGCGERNLKGKAGYYIKSNTWYHQEENRIRSQSKQPRNTRLRVFPGKWQPRRNCRAVSSPDWGRGLNTTTPPYPKMITNSPHLENVILKDTTTKDIFIAMLAWPVFNSFRLPKFLEYASQKAGLEIPLSLTIKVLNKILQKVQNLVGFDSYLEQKSVFVGNSVIF